MNYFIVAISMKEFPWAVDLKTKRSVQLLITFKILPKSTHRVYNFNTEECKKKFLLKILFFVKTEPTLRSKDLESFFMG